MVYATSFYAYITLSLTLFFAIIQGFFYLAILKPEVVLKGFLNNLCNNKVFCYMVVGCLAISRTLLSLSDKEFKRFSIASAIFLITFLHYRLGLVLGFNKADYFWVACTVFMYVGGTINAVLRLSIKVGAVIDNQICTSESVKSIIYEMTEKVFKGAFRTTRQMLTSPNPDMPKARSFNRFGVYAAMVSVPIAGFVAWDNHLSRLANEASAKAAEQSAKAAEVVAKAKQQRSDIKAVKHGLMAIEKYHNKYPEN